MLKLNFVEGFIINFNSGKARESQISYLSSLTSKNIFFYHLQDLCKFRTVFLSIYIY